MIGFLFCTVLSVALLVGDGLFLLGFIRQATSRNYLQTTGEVTQSKFVAGMSQGPSKYQHGMQGLLRYSYTVNGQTFESDRFRCIDFISRNDFVANHPVGTKVAVFYNPKTPHESVLFQGLDNSDWIALKVAIIPNLLMLCFWIFAWIKFKRRFPNLQNFTDYLRS